MCCYIAFCPNTTISIFSVEGLVPSGGPLPLEVKVRTALAQLRDKPRPIDKYVFVQSLQDSDETLYYALLLAHTAEGIVFL